ncbi:PQQ-binding-like beta-propeller repeat protein [Botrimarina sp.]|uniref:outer membrane protein assembly factor BamB family protein n=1 Tax=Botrimarina sp. TaxID=2795802 RepID=UPI0032EC2349
MATAKQFLDTIEQENLVSADVLSDLYEDYHSSGGAMTAEALAERLVARGEISQQKASSLLLTSSDSFIQVNAASLSDTPKKPEPVADDPFDSELDTKRGSKKVERDAAGRRKHVKKTHKNDFDSPLLLIGGGALALLLLGGLGMLVLMNVQSGDQVLSQAEEAYAAGSYAQARESYEQFVEDYTSHARWSDARVNLAIVRLRQLTETARDWQKALSVAQQEIPLVEDEDAFPEKRGEFASLLPRIARGLADQAASQSEAAPGSEEVERLANAAEQALVLVANTKYVPKRLRDEGEIAAIGELLTRVERRREAAGELETTLQAIAAATDAGEPAVAYEAHAQFIANRPELRDDERLAAALADAVEAERQTIRFVEEPAAATEEPRPTPVSLALPLANPIEDGRVAADGLYLAPLGGALYAVAADDGALRWRRYLGESLSQVDPVRVGDGLLLVDHRHGELLRVGSADGALEWRTPIEPPPGAITQPVAAGDRVLVATESGKLWRFNAQTGDRDGYADFAQPLRAAPAVDAERGVAYVAGRQSSLYTLDLESLECVAVRYTGHAAGEAPVPPVALDGRVLFLQNTGLETSRLTVFRTDEQGHVAEQVADWRLEGVAGRPMRVDGRRVLVATDSGAVYLFEVTPGVSDQPLSLLAKSTATGSRLGSQSVVEVGGEVWIAGDGLRRTAASLADSTLVARPLADPCDGDRFVGPIAHRGDAILHARIRRGRPGLTIAATDRSSGQLVWQTAVATPPLAAPIVSQRSRAVLATAVTGAVHEIGPEQIRAGLSPRPAAQPEGAEAYSSASEVGAAVVLARPESSSWFAVPLAAPDRARAASLVGQLATDPAPLGGALVAPLRVGQVHVLDPLGRSVAKPFQPEVRAGEGVAWTAPAVGEAAGETVVVLSDGQSDVYCLRVDQAGDSPALVQAGMHRMTEDQPLTRAAIVGSTAAVGLARGLALYQLPDLPAPRVAPLPGAIAWGPYAAGDLVLLATESSEIVAVSADGQVAWSTPAQAGPLVGPPLVDGDDVLIASLGGVVSRRRIADGEQLGQIDLGQPIATGPTAYGPRLLVAAADGTVLVASQP